MNREWGIPIALGLVVAAGLWAAQPAEDAPAQTPSSGSTTPAPRPAALLLPFEESLGVERADTTHLVLAPQGRSAALALLNESEIPLPELDWRGDRVAFYTGTNVLSGCHDVNGTRQCGDPWWNLEPWPLPRTNGVPESALGPRLGLGGYNGTRATIYVFDQRGLLAATNAEGDWSRFAGAPTTMESEVWYIGANGTAPNGTEKPPSFAAPLVQKLRPLMEGLPVGGVTSTQSNAYVSLYGTLFITIRIDELVYAP